MQISAERSLDRWLDIRLDLIAVGDPVHAVEQFGHRDYLSQAFVVETQPQHGGCVRVDSILAAVGD